MQGDLGPEVFFTGFTGAAGRFNEQDRFAIVPGAFIPLFEALSWAVTLDEQIAHNHDDRWDWRGGHAHGLTMRGVRYARNLAHHDWTSALNHSGGRRFPMTFPVVFAPAKWRWKPLEALPDPGRNDPEGSDAYRRRLSGRAAGETLRELSELFRDTLGPPGPGS